MKNSIIENIKDSKIDLYKEFEKKVRDFEKNQYGDKINLFKEFEKIQDFDSSKDFNVVKYNDRTKKFEKIQNTEKIQNIETSQNFDSSKNNGGSTDYYDFPENAKCVMDLIEIFGMNFSQGNILKSAYCLNRGRHDGTNMERELNKIIFFAKRELERISNIQKSKNSKS